MRWHIRPWQPWALLAAILVGGFFLRLWIAPHYTNGDSGITQNWMESAVKFGVSASYEKQVNNAMLPTYPPLSMYLFQGAGLLYKAFVSEDYTVTQPAHLVFVKLPAILADALIALVAFLMLLRWKKPIAGLSAAAIFMLHPAALYNSTLWGQTDSIYTCVFFVSLLAYVCGFPAMGFTVAVLACLVKPQAIAFLPLALFLIPLRPKAILASIALSLACVFLVLVPFILKGQMHDVMRVYHVFDLLGETRVSWNAYNFWWLVLGPQKALGTHGGDILFWIINYRTVGLALFASTLLATLFFLRKHLRGDLSKPIAGQALLLAATMSAFAFFMLNAEMHERYAYPVIAFFLPLAFVRIRYAFVYFFLSLGYMLNMLGVFRFGGIDNFLFEKVPNFSLGVATMQVVTFFVIAWFIVRFERKRN